MVLVVAIYTMFLLTLSRIALSVLLAIGPLIIPLYLFQATRRFVETWIAQLATYAFVAVLAGLVAALMMHLIGTAAAQAQAAGGGIQIVHAIRVCIAAGFTFLIMRQVLPMASGLASGIALSTFGTLSGLQQRATFSLGQFARGAVLDRETTRWDPLSRKVGYAVGGRVRSAFRRNNSVRG
jgi:type IV secretion system protein VirB6